MFTQSGWINTFASGTVNPDTVTYPSYGVANSVYQVWRFNDDLHNNGGKPVFIKVGYGPHSTFFGFSSMAMYFTVGFGHNGSGSLLTGSTPTLLAVSDNGGGGTSLFTHRMCCISGSDLVGVVRDAFTDSITNVNNVMGIFLVERTKDKNGNSTGDGVVLSVSGYRSGIIYTPSTYLPSSSVGNISITGV
jgi:hypothetical protein